MHWESTPLPHVLALPTPAQKAEHCNLWAIEGQHLRRAIRGSAASHAFHVGCAWCVSINDLIQQIGARNNVK